VELIREKIKTPFPSKPKIIFSAKVNGLNLKNGLNKNFIKIKNIKGNFSLQIDLKAKRIGRIVELAGELGKILEPGIYFAELVVFHKGITPLISYVKFKIE
jgi:hypothetical protein